MRDDKQRLEDILEAITRVEKYTARGMDVFEGDELVQTWVVHHLQIIGEAARRVSVALQEQYKEVPWPQIVAMRNILVHDYFAVDIKEVWATVEHDLPDLKQKIEAILTSMGKSKEL